MRPDQEHADDAATGPLPIIGPDGRPGFGAPPEPSAAGPEEERGGAVPPPDPGTARERPAAEVPPAGPSDAPAEPPYRQGLMAAAVLGAVLVLVAGVVAARLWP
ncbi:hypothetical protein ACIBF1_24585 [Spirillospora sp. NPDC050679]